MDLNSPFFTGKRMGKVPNVAEELGVTRAAVYQWMNNGVPIPYYEVKGLGFFFDLDQVAAWHRAATHGGLHPVKYEPNRTPPQPFPQDIPNSPADAARAWRK